MDKNRQYIDKVHTWGKAWGFSAAIIIMLFPIAIALIFQTMPSMEGFAKGFIAVAPMFWAVGTIEVFTYVPMMGAGSSYLGFVTGNLSNLKVPCALNALEQTDTKAGSPEGEVISTIATAVSSIVTTIIIVLGVALIAPLTPLLSSELLEPAFANILPALFGGLGVVYISKNWKIAVAPVALMLLLFFFVPALNAGLVGLMVPVGVLFTIGVSRVLYKKGIIKG